MRIGPTIAIVVGLALAGCGSSDAPLALASADDTTTSTPQPSSTTTEATTTSTPTPTSGAEATTTTAELASTTTAEPVAIRIESDEGLDLLPASVEHCIVAELGGNTTVFAALAGSPGFHTLDYSVQTSVAVGALRCTSTGGLNAGYTTNVLPVGPEHLADEDYLACVDSYLAGGSGSDVMAGLIIRSELVPVAGAPRDAVEAMAADCINDAFVVANFVNRDAVIDGYVEECVSQALVANGDAISRQVVANALSAPNELPNYTVPPGALPECLQPQG